jgi:hypothetical protein
LYVLTRELPRRIVTRPVPFAAPADASLGPAEGDEAAAVLRTRPPAPLSLQPAMHVGALEVVATGGAGRAAPLPLRCCRVWWTGSPILVEGGA